MTKLICALALAVTLGGCASMPNFQTIKEEILWLTGQSAPIACAAYMAARPAIVSPNGSVRQAMAAADSICASPPPVGDAAAIAIIIRAYKAARAA